MGACGEVTLLYTSVVYNHAVKDLDCPHLPYREIRKEHYSLAFAPNAQATPSIVVYRIIGNLGGEASRCYLRKESHLPFAKQGVIAGRISPKVVVAGSAKVSLFQL